MKLSIAIPTYNRKFFLEKTVLSFLNQICSDVEIVISDNHSTDDTQKYLNQLQHTYPFINVVYQTHNQGIDVNILTVLEHCRGEYVFFFGDDDLLPCDGLKEILTEINHCSFDLICLNHQPLKESIAEIGEPFLPEKRIEFSDGEKFFKYVGLGFLSSLIIKRERAISFTKSVQIGKESAHLEIAARVALSSKKLLYLGTLSVLARAPSSARYDLMSSCVIYLKSSYDKLLQERFLSFPAYRFFVNKLIFKEIPRIVYKTKETSDRKKLLVLAQKTFSQHSLGLLLIGWFLYSPRRVNDAIFFLIKKIFFKR